MSAPGRSDTPAPSAVADLLAHARQGLDRVAPEGLEDERAAGALVVDIRPEANRMSEGCLPGSVVIDRNVLEWRLDPTSPDRIAQADRQDLRVILVCNEGYASSLAAESLRRLGLFRATDLDGGYRAWCRERRTPIAERHEQG
jgi:rhodanese-related sulfurtransferase